MGYEEPILVEYRNNTREKLDSLCNTADQLCDKLCQDVEHFSKETVEIANSYITIRAQVESIHHNSSAAVKKFRMEETALKSQIGEKRKQIFSDLKSNLVEIKRRKKEKSLANHYHN